MGEEKCAQCGTPATPGAKYCESCGAPLVAPAQPVQGPAAAEPAPSYAEPGAQAQYQGVAIRFVAILIDLIIVWVLISWILRLISWILTSLLLPSIVNPITGAVTPFGAAYAAIVVIGTIISLLYFILLLGHYGQTVGMWAAKIKVVKEADYSAISYGEAAIRTILLYIDEIPYAIPFLLGAVLIWRSDKKQRLGDRVARTVVVKA